MEDVIEDDEIPSSVTKQIDDFFIDQYMSNIVKDELLCNYEFYAQREVLAMDLNEYDCTKLGTKTCVYEGSPLMFCDEHYPLVAAKNHQ